MAGNVDWDARAERYDTLGWVNDGDLLAWSRDRVLGGNMMRGVFHSSTPRTLEIGAGTGALTEQIVGAWVSLGSRGRVVACDVSAAMREKLAARIQSGVEIVDLNPFDAWKTIEGFDLIYMRMVLRHQTRFRSATEAIASIRPLLRPNGVIVVLDGVPPNTDKRVVDWYNDVMRIKHGTARLSCLTHEITDGMFAAGAREVRAADRFTDGNSLKNWLDAANVLPLDRDEVWSRHWSGSAFIRDAYAMRNTDDDVLMRWRHTAVAALFP